jgi:uncharacterized protein (DUF58 family)
MTLATPRLLTSGLLGLAGLVGAVLTRRPEPALLAAPFLTTAVVGLVAMRAPTVELRAWCEPVRVLQGETVTLHVELSGPGTGGRARVVVDLPPGLESADDQRRPGREVPLRPVTSLEWPLVATGWGAIASVGVSVTTTDALGATERRVDLAVDPIRVLPREHTIQRAVGPRALRSIAGTHLSRHRGDGIEFVDTREFVAGDRSRDVNWRVSARRDELWVDERRPERSGEVVIFLDTFAAIGDSVDNTLRRTVELAQALTSRHIALNDRVGLVDLGGVLRWVRPSGGTVQLYRIVETLIETEMWASGADKTIDVLPARALPRRSLVIALSPLVDPRGVRALTTLRARQFDVAVVEVVAASFVPASTGRTAQLAARLWAVEQEATRRELRSHGIAVGEWHDGEPLDPVLQSMDVFRTAVLRSAR